ncbi:peptidase M14 [Phlegmacium glaucopus]|nr:peptidase M14 [Phlegmacium glaucopus]
MTTSSMVLSLLLLITVLHCGFSLALVEHQQHVLTPEPTSTRNQGVLRRFSTKSTLQQILIAAQQHDLDIWHATPSYVDIFSPLDAPPLPSEMRTLPHITTQISVPITTPIPLTTNWDLHSLENTTFHDSYHPLSQIESFMQELADAHPNTARLISIGRSAQGRDIFGLTISARDKSEKDHGKKNKRKKRITRKHREKLGFVIQGAQHAREWIAMTTSLYLTHALVANTSEKHSVARLLRHFDFHIIPVPNPDGYDYTWQTDRLWYKNRQIINSYSDCVGLDMNRNWGYKWKPDAIEIVDANATKHNRSSTDPCSHWYPGSRAFQSPEVNSIANWVSTLPNVIGFIDLRSYGQMLSTPYSYSCRHLSEDAEDQLEAAFGAAQSLKTAHGTVFQTGSLCSMLYTAPGNVIDWMYARQGIKYSYAVHLRDTGTFGFALPEKWIRPTGEETLNLVNYLAKFIAKHAKKKF